MNLRDAADLALLGLSKNGRIRKALEKADPTFREYLRLDQDALETGVFVLAAGERLAFGPGWDLKRLFQALALHREKKQALHAKGGEVVKTVCKTAVTYLLEAAPKKRRTR